MVKPVEKIFLIFIIIILFCIILFFIFYQTNNKIDETNNNLNNFFDNKEVIKDLSLMVDLTDENKETYYKGNLIKLKIPYNKINNFTLKLILKENEIKVKEIKELNFNESNIVSKSYDGIVMIKIPYSYYLYEILSYEDENGLLNVN